MNEPSALPWYRSPVYVTGITQTVSMIVVALGVQTLYPIEIINLWVQIAFAVIGIVAGIIGESKRRNSTLQPLTLTKAGAEIASQIADEPAPTIAPQTSATRTPQDWR